MPVSVKIRTLMLVLLLTGCDDAAPVTPPQMTRQLEHFHPSFSKLAEDYWRLTRDCAVVMGTVVAVTDRVTFRVDRVLKGEAVAETISFPAPPILADRVERQLVSSDPRFQPTERWILFLGRPALRVYAFRAGASGAEIPRVEQSVKESLAFDALLDDRSRCAFLVQVAVSRSLSWRPALQRLEEYNTAEFLPLLAPLATDALGKRLYWRLLTTNPNPDGTTILRKFARSERAPLLSEVVEALGRRDRGSEEVSRELMSYLTHSDAQVRRSAVFILGVRDYRPAFPDIVLRLEDASPDVRAFALTWPWYAYVTDHPEVMKQIKGMRSDPDPHVRSSAKSALAGVSPWYRVWYLGR